MFVNTKLIAVCSAIVFAASVNAQSSSAAAPTTTAGLSTCLLGCLTSAASSGGCTSITDLSCVCTNTKFQTAAAQCLQSKCTKDEQASALQLQQAECANVSGSSGSSGSTSPTGTSSASASSSSSASMSKLQYNSGGLVGVVSILAGALIGAGLVL